MSKVKPKKPVTVILSARQGGATVQIRMEKYFEKQRSTYTAWLNSDRDFEFVGPLAGRAEKKTKSKIAASS